MAQTRKPKPKQGPTGKNQPGRGSGTAAKARQPDKGKLARGAAARRLEEKKRRQRTLLWTGVAVVTLVALVGADRVHGPRGAAGREPAGGRRGAGRRPGSRPAPRASRPSPWPARTTSAPTSSPTTGTRTRRPPATTWPPRSRPASTTTSRTCGPWSTTRSTATWSSSTRASPPTRSTSCASSSRPATGPSWSWPPGPAWSSNGVALTAWQNLETLQRVNMDVVQAFVNDYMVPGATKSTAPEPNAA